MTASKREKWRVLKFVVTTSTNPQDAGKVSYTLLKPYPKESYIAHLNTIRAKWWSEYNDVEGLYVDIKTRKLWQVVKDNIEDIETFAIEETLNDGMVIEPYDERIASRMVTLKFLQENLVELWCR